MDKIKAYVFDLDGTLLNSECKISLEEVKYIKKLKKEGKSINFSSRSHLLAQMRADKLKD